MTVQGKHTLQLQGFWSTQSQEIHTPSRRKELTFLALLTLGCLGIGAYYLQSNPLLGRAFLIGGAGFCLVDLVAIYRFKSTPPPQPQKTASEPKPAINATYNVVSWNISRFRDYTRMCFLKNEMAAGKTLAQAWAGLPPYTQDCQITTEEAAERDTLFHNAFGEMQHPDIICLQETLEKNDTALLSLLPAGYQQYTYRNQQGTDCTVVWDASKFDLVDHAVMHYDQLMVHTLNLSPDTVVLLKDKNNGAKLCVASVHLRGFNLDYENLSNAQKAQELEKAKDGDRQARYCLNTMELVEADLYIFAGDFNVTPEAYLSRFNLIGWKGYGADPNEKVLTIFDAYLKEAGAPKAVQLDYIRVKEGKGRQASIEKKALNGDVHNFAQRPSDHLPVAATITLKS